jgi:hypothetical protein
MRSIPGQGNALETEPSFDDAACCPFESFYRANRNEKQPDYQYHCAYLPVLGICCTFATKRYKASAAYAAVKAALPTKKRQTTPVEECKYLLQPGDTQKIPALKTQGFSRRTAKPGAMRPDYRIPYLRRIFRIRGSRSEIMRS